MIFLKRKTLWMLMGLFIGCMLLLLSETIQAQENVDFSVRAILPENQRDTNQTYYDLRVEPGQEQELETVLYNRSNEEITVIVSLNNATTNSNGLIVYNESVNTDPNVINQLTDLAEVRENEVTIQAGETVSVITDLNIPNEDFDGVILGGLHFQKKLTDTEEENTEGVSLSNEYAYVIGVQLTQNDEEVIPELSLMHVEATLFNYRTAVVAQIQNNAPVIINHLTLSADVYRDDVLERSTEMESVSMAPNSTMDFIVDWDNQLLEAGEYRVEIQALHSDGEWIWSEEFTISEEAQEVVNEEAVMLAEEANVVVESQQNHLLYGIIILLVVLLIGMLLYIIKGNR